MINTRISSDPDLLDLADELQGMDVLKLRELSLMLIERGAKLISLDNSLAVKVCELLRKEQEIPVDLLRRMQAESDKADGHYLDILETEGAESNKCVDAFSKARILRAHCFAAEEEKMSFLDSIYESYVGTNRHVEMLEAVRRFVSAKAK